MSRFATGLALALTAAGCTEEQDCDCASSGYEAPSGGAGDSDTRDEVYDFRSLSAEECQTFVEVAEDNPESDLQINVIPNRIDSAWVGDLLTYKEDFTVDDEVNPDLARPMYACVAWEVEGVRSFAPSSEALRDGVYLTVGAETTPGLTDQVDSLRLWVIVDEDRTRNDLRFGQFGSMDHVTRIVDQSAEEDPISE